MTNDWNPTEPSIQLHQIIENEETIAVTLSSEMLDYLKVIIGEKVKIEMRENKLVISKIIPSDEADGLSEHYFAPLNETPTPFVITETTMKES